MNHVLITRFHYKKGDKRFAWRYAYWKNIVLPRLLSQTDKDFDIAIRCHPWHDRFFKFQGIDRVFPFHIQGDEEREKRIGEAKYFEDFFPWSKVKDLKKYCIQSGLDSDDLVSENYIEKIKTEISKDPFKSAHLSFVPEILNLEKNRIEPIGQKYIPGRGSAFFSIYQPDKGKDYIFAYQESHLTIGRKFERQILLPKGDCWATVHAANYSTRSTQK